MTARDQNERYGILLHGRATRFQAHHQASRRISALQIELPDFVNHVFLLCG
jgi:hypothetical protein